MGPQADLRQHPRLLHWLQQAQVGTMLLAMAADGLAAKAAEGGWQAGTRPSQGCIRVLRCHPFGISIHVCSVHGWNGW